MRLLWVTALTWWGVSAQSGQFCPSVDVIGSPVNIIAEYIGTLLGALDIENSRTTVGLLDILSASDGDLERIKFVFRIDNRATDIVSYVGVWAAFPVDRSQSTRYRIEKFIQSVNLEDVKIVLELPPGLHTTSLLCSDFRYSFLETLLTRGFFPRAETLQRYSASYSETIARHMRLWQAFLDRVNIEQSLGYTTTANGGYSSRSLLDQLLAYISYSRLSVEEGGPSEILEVPGAGRVSSSIGGGKKYVYIFFFEDGVLEKNMYTFI